MPERVSTNYTAYDKLQSNAEQEWQNFRKARENFVGNAVGNIIFGMVVEGIYSVNNAAGDRSNETTVWSGSYDASKAFLANQWGKIGIAAIGIDEETIDKIKDDMEKN